MYCKFCASPTDLKNAICENCNKEQIAKNSARLRFWGIIALLFFLMGTVVVTYDAYIKEKESSSYTTSLDSSNDPNPDLTAISDPIETVTSPAPTESFVDSNFSLGDIHGLKRRTVNAPRVRRFYRGLHTSCRFLVRK